VGVALGRPKLITYCGSRLEAKARSLVFCLVTLLGTSCSRGATTLLDAFVPLAEVFLGLVGFFVCATLATCKASLGKKTSKIGTKFAK